MLEKPKTKPLVKADTNYFIREVIGSREERAKLKRLIHKITEELKKKDLDEILIELDFVNLPYEIKSLLASRLLDLYGIMFSSILLTKDRRRKK